MKRLILLLAIVFLGTGLRAASAKMNLNLTSLNLSSATLNLSFRFSNLSFTLPILSFKILPVLFPASVYAHIARTHI